MKIHVTAFIIILFTVSETGRSQNIDSSSISEIMNHEYLKYKDKNGRLISEKPMEAGVAKVIFYAFSLNKEKRIIKIEGIVIDPSAGYDTTGIVNYIFVATPIKERLTKLRLFGTTHHRSNNDPHKNIFPFRNGDFSIEFKFNKKERLYFNSEDTFPIEYNIGALLKTS